MPKIQCQLMKEYDKYDSRIILEDICPGLEYKPRGPPEVEKNRKKPWRIGMCEKYHRIGIKTREICFCLIDRNLYI